MPSSMSEEDLFKTLLKKKPEAQKPHIVQKAQVPVKKETPRAVPAEQPVEEKPVERAVTPPAPVKPAEIELVADSIKSLNASVNMMYGLIKTVIVPVLVLLLIIGIALLVKLK